MLTWTPDFCPSNPPCRIELYKTVTLLPTFTTDTRILHDPFSEETREITRTTQDRLVDVNWSTPKSFVTLCTHHQGLKDSGLTDQHVFDAILQSSRVKETARWQIKVELGLDKEHPGVPYRVNPDGSFTIPTDRASLAWTLEDGSPGPLPAISTPDRARARAAANSAVLRVSRPSGTSTVTVE